MNPETQQLTEQEKRVKIAEACGIKPERYFRKMVWTWNGKMHTAPPNYFRDLNAIHEAEKMLAHEQHRLYETKMQIVILEPAVQQAAPVRLGCSPSRGILSGPL